MEQGESEYEFLVLVWLSAVIKIFGLIVGVSTHQVRSETSWGLQCHLDGALKDRHWECRRWRGGQPDTEIWMVLVSELLDNSFESCHPELHQVAILK